MALTVLGGGVSPFVRKVRVVLAEKGLDYQHENVNPFGPPEGWREISPLGRIPAFKDGDKVINDSSVICAYLERRFPKPALYPTDDYEYARAHHSTSVKRLPWPYVLRQTMRPPSSEASFWLR